MPHGYVSGLRATCASNGPRRAFGLGSGATCPLLPLRTLEWLPPSPKRAEPASTPRFARLVPEDGTSRSNARPPRTAHRRRFLLRGPRELARKCSSATRASTGDSARDRWQPAEGQGRRVVVDSATGRPASPRDLQNAFGLRSCCSRRPYRGFMIRTRGSSRSGIIRHGRPQDDQRRCPRRRFLPKISVIVPEWPTERAQAMARRPKTRACPGGGRRLHA